MVLAYVQLTWLDFGYADLRVDELTKQRPSEGAHGMFRCTVDSTSRVSLASGNRANVNDMAGVSGLEIYTRGISRI